MLVLIVLLAVAPFLAIVMFGAPYVRTLRSQRRLLKDVFELDKGAVIVDFGAGDASVVLALAAAGYKAVGYELNPILFAIGWLRCVPFDNANMKLGNYWQVKLPDDTKGIFIFSAGRFMYRLQKKLKKDFPDGVQLVTFAFELPDQKPDKTIEGLHLYKL